MSIIRMRSIVKVFEMDHVSVNAVRDVSLDIERGDFLTVVGPSGSGKTTLLHIMGCLSVPTGGSYFFDSMDVGAMSDTALALIRSKRIGFVFQSFNLIPSMNALENVKLPLLYGDHNHSNRKDKALSMLERLGLSHRITHYPNQLSGGEQQRVAIARALVSNPDIILADEPTGNLDSENGIQIMDILKSLNKEGKTVVVVTHNEKIADYGHRTIFVEDGLIA